MENLNNTNKLDKVSKGANAINAVITLGCTVAAIVVKVKDRIAQKKTPAIEIETMCETVSEDAITFEEVNEVNEEETEA